MKRIAAVIALVLFLAGSAGVVFAKSDILDMIFKDEPGTQAPAPQNKTNPGNQGYIVEIKMANGQTFRVETDDPKYDDVEFKGMMKIEQPDGTYYVNSSQVQYIRVIPQ